MRRVTCSQGYVAEHNKKCKKAKTTFNLERTVERNKGADGREVSRDLASSDVAMERSPACALRGGLSNLSAEADERMRAALRSTREELEAALTNLREELRSLRKDTRHDVQHLKQRSAACWEGMRESRVELGDVMQTLHHLVERSELQVRLAHRPPSRHAIPYACTGVARS